MLRSCTITSRLPYHLQDKAADTTHPFHGTLFWSLTADRDMVLCSPISRRSSLGGYWRSASPRTYYQPDLDVEPQVVWRQGTRSNRKHTFAMRGFCGQRQCVRRLLQRYGWKQSILISAYILLFPRALGNWRTTWKDVFSHMMRKLRSKRHSNAVNCQLTRRLRPYFRHARPRASQPRIPTEYGP